MRLFTFRNIRIAVLLGGLAWAASYTSGATPYSRSWPRPLAVTVFPVNATGDEGVARYLKALSSGDFAAIDRFMAKEGSRYDIATSEPTMTDLGPEAKVSPPPPPSIQ